MKQCAIGTEKNQTVQKRATKQIAQPCDSAVRASPWRQRFGAALKILSQVVAIFGTIMAIVDTLHRW